MGSCGAAEACGAGRAAAGTGSATGCGADVTLGRLDIASLIGLLKRFLEEMHIGPIPLPDPPDDVLFGGVADPVRVREAELRRGLVAMAKTAGPSVAVGSG